MKMKTNWNLGLLYKSDNDPQIKKDLEMMEVLCLKFEKKYRGKPFTSSPQSLAKAIKDYENLEDKLNWKPWWYFSLKVDFLDSNDKKSRSLVTQYEQRLNIANNRIKFFTLEIAKIPGKNHRIFLNNPMLKPYKYFLQKIFNKAKYNLSEPEEQLLNLVTQTSYTMWTDLQEKVLNQQSVPYKGKQLLLTEAISMLPELQKNERRVMNDRINKSLKSISHIAEGELNAVYNFKKVIDERCGYEKPYSSTILSYENNEQNIKDFIKLVSKSFSISQRFYKLHARLLGEKKLLTADRGAKIGSIKTEFDYKTSVGMVKNAFGKIGKEYRAIFESFLENGQIDVYPRKGKRSGAWCISNGTLPAYVLLNHQNQVRSLETLAHEMGHAIHNELSKKQPPLYRGHSYSTGEVASTFFEQVILDEVEKHLTKKEKIILLHSKLLGDIATVFRQIACFNFENELHEMVRREGQVSAEAIADTLNKHLKQYLGPVFSVTQEDGYFFVYWTHIRRFFYVYTYAYGQLISRALYERYLKDPTYAKKIKMFLSSGSKMSPEDIFKSIGIDTSHSFFEEGLKGIEKDIIKLEKLTK